MSPFCPCPPAALGDLKRFSTVQDHHVSKHGFHCSFFTPDSRPHCLRGRHSLCEVTPVGALRGADLYRKDGMRSSNLFKLWPVVLREHTVKTPDMNLPRKQGQAMVFSKQYKRLTPRPRTVHGTEHLDLHEHPEEREEGDPGPGRPPATGDPALSRSQPSIMVAVDTSGTGFYRMSSFRQSLKGTASLDRKRRRRTVSGVPGRIMHEIQAFERGKRNARTTPRDYRFDDGDRARAAEKDESMARYLEEMDARMEEKAQQRRATSLELKLLRYLPCRRERSLPRCAKTGGEGNRRVMVFEQEEPRKDQRPCISRAVGGSHSSSLSLGSAGGSSVSTSSRASRRSSLLNLSRIRSFVSHTLRPRPKSLDLDSISVLDNDADNEDDSSSSASTQRHTQRHNTLQRSLSPSMPEDLASLASSRESCVGPGTYYDFSGSSMPRVQARKYDFPWESLPKDWTTSVQLREISRRRREERNSSSGNWSGSSNRQSLDSARSSTLPSSTSQHSLGKDSGRDSPSTGEDRELSEQAARDSGISTFMPLRRNRGGSAPDTEQWLSSLARRAASREECAGAHVTRSLTRLSQLTKQNIQALEDTFSPRLLQAPDDELSSAHSLDQDGFYTSFHTDSGLRRGSVGTLLGGRDGDGELQPLKKAHSTLSMGSSNTIDSVIFRPSGARGVSPQGGGGGGGGGKLRPPPPPLRVSSRMSSTSSLVEAQETLKSVGEALAAADVSTPRADPAPAPSTLSLNPAESSQSESSDQETIYARLRAKTKISSRSIPSWCLISDGDSTDSSSVCLNRADPKHAPSFSLLKSRLGAGAVPKSSSLTESSSTLLGCGDAQGEEGDTFFDCSTLPRRYSECKAWEEDMADHCNSWPRSRRTHESPSAGILKSDKPAAAGSLKPKTLNFAPMVNMYDHHTSQGIELPLHATSSTSSSSSVDCGSDASAKGSGFKLSARLLPEARTRPAKAGGGVSKPSHGAHSHLYAVSEVAGARRGSTASSGRSVSSSESSLPSLSDCGQGGYLDMSGGLGHRAHDTWSSSSSAALSDLDGDSSMTYVTMSSSNSTPTNSTLALGPDKDPSTPVNSPRGPDGDHPTPVNSPRLQHDTYRVTPLTLAGGHLGLPPHVTPSTPTLASPPPPSQTDGLTVTPTGRPPSGSLSGTRAAGSWGGPGARTSSEDSGFSSPTTPTGALAGLHHHLHHHQRQPQPHSAKPFTGDTATRGLQADGLRPVTGSEEDSERTRNSTPPSQLSLGRKHQALQASPSADHPKLRSDSYPGKAFQGSSGGDGSVRPKTRSQSTAEMPGAARSPSHTTLLSKSISCPTGVLAEAAEGVSRADSYRVAVRNTQGVVGDVATRSSSYRLATREDDPVSDDRMDAANTWSGRRSLGSRDVRRMGITDIDQLKHYDDSDSSGKASSSSLLGAKPSSSRSSSSSSLSAKLSSSKPFAGINSSRKKMRPEVQNLLRGDKTPSPEAKRMAKVSSGKGTKDKTKPTAPAPSSTYIRFDPIFEAGDDMYSSTDTLRAESVEMISAEGGCLMGDRVVGKLPPGKVRGGGGGRKHVDEKAVMSILDSIKSTIKSMSGGKSSSADKDAWKYDGGV
ncbi:hypothetical protein ACOMHN_007979 [Nucella lapillus]